MGYESCSDDARADKRWRGGMTLDEYQGHAMRTQGGVDQVCAALGMCGESGEFADLVKKEIYHGHPPDHARKVKELGDVLWYVAAGCEALGVTLSDVAEINLAKLRARYPERFSSEASLNRAPDSVNGGGPDE